MKRVASRCGIRFPRVRGDGPCACRQRNRPATVPPRARGWSLGTPVHGEPHDGHAIAHLKHGRGLWVLENRPAARQEKERWIIRE